MVFQIIVQLAFRTKVAGDSADRTYDKSGQVRLFALDVFGIDAVITDFRIGHCDDLTTITGIGENFLVSGHRGVKNDLTFHLAISAKGMTNEDSTICQDKFCGLHHLHH